MIARRLHAGLFLPRAIEAFRANLEIDAFICRKSRNPKRVKLIRTYLNLLSFGAVSAHEHFVTPDKWSSRLTERSRVLAGRGRKHTIETHGHGRTWLPEFHGNPGGRDSSSWPIVIAEFAKRPFAQTVKYRCFTRGMRCSTTSRRLAKSTTTKNYRSRANAARIPLETHQRKPVLRWSPRVCHPANLRNVLTIRGAGGSTSALAFSFNRSRSDHSHRGSIFIKPPTRSRSAALAQ